MLHWLVVTPSQSMSMSAFHQIPLLAPQTGMLAAPPLSVAKRPLEIWLQVVIFARSWAAVGPFPPGVGVGVAVGSAVPPAKMLTSVRLFQPFTLLPWPRYRTRR